MGTNNLYGIGKIREMIIGLHKLESMNEVYTFYYDETNNARKFRLKEEGFNSSMDENFVLGGIVYKGKNKALDTDRLFNELNLQTTVKELKGKHISKKSNYIEYISSNKLNIFLKWIDSNEILLHYSNMNNLYFAIVDIVDSVIDERISYDIGFVNYLKNILYKYIKQDIDFIQKVFYQFKYPNIRKEDCHEFCSYLIYWIEDLNCYNEEEDFALEFLQQCIKKARKENDLLFLEDNTDYILMNDFSCIYRQSIFMFPNSYHIFDEETEVFKIIDNEVSHMFEEELDNYKCVKSTEDRLVQISDVIIGHLGKYFTFINKTDIRNYDSIIGNLGIMELENIYLLNKLMKKSDKENRAFIQNICSFSDVNNYNTFFKIATIRYEAIKN
ncbi:DUF3800 domain-containing protein [Clostridium gasigenes]|uniref:DUF3800 domain-containing protein n=1 Tax=Clostridium gasigenes TaxID=94869 RepID=UPI001C0C664D|nr:DUF3800 domain-containing protein [Clostridium gasigenes]MBU3102923.1 hypothetical protein [Clostridium gasigenes]